MFTLDPAFVRPSYDKNCFTAVPASIGPLLDASGIAALPETFLPDRPRAFRAVVLILLDGFGWRFIEKVADDYPALRRFAAARGVAKLTSQFPSTTAAHITCLNSGLEVGQSGVYEWSHSDPDARVLLYLRTYRLTGGAGPLMIRCRGSCPQGDTNLSPAPGGGATGGQRCRELRLSTQYRRS